MRIGSVCSCLVFVFFCLPLVSSCNAAPKIPAVVSVDMQRLMTESEPAKQASEHLGEVRAVLQKYPDRSFYLVSFREFITF